jgi:hypothetical protein
MQLSSTDRAVRHGPQVELIRHVSDSARASGGRSASTVLRACVRMHPAMNAAMRAILRK